MSYLQLAHNVHHPDTGVSTAQVIHNFGRADQVDRNALARLVRSIARVLDPADAGRARKSALTHPDFRMLPHRRPRTAAAPLHQR